MSCQHPFYSPYDIMELIVKGQKQNNAFLYSKVGGEELGISRVVGLILKLDNTSEQIIK